MKEEDIQPDLFFTCTVENMELKDYKFGEQFGIRVVKRPGERCKFWSLLALFKLALLRDVMFFPVPPYIPPQQQYVSDSDITALRGESFELFCIFSGL